MEKKTINSSFSTIFMSNTEYEYPFKWIDQLITQSLNINNSNKIASDFESLIRQLEEENSRIQLLIKSQFFNSIDDNNIAVLIRRYHSILTILINQTREKRKHFNENESIYVLSDAIIECLYNLLSFITIHFSDYLDVKYLEQNKLPFQTQNKIICLLSADQIGLILKAADDSKVIVSKSLTEVFRTIVPYLSTLRKVELSYEAMRISCYSPEEKDIQVAIECLEKMIRIIKDY